MAAITLARGRDFRAGPPDCELSLHVTEVRDPYGPLRRSEIDVLVNWLVVDEADLTTGPVIDRRDRVLAVGCGHRLAGRESVCVEDLGDEEVHENTPTFPEALYDTIAPRFTPSGRPIRRSYPWKSDEDVLTAVARGRIVHMGMVGTALGRPDFVLVPVRDLPPMPLGLIWCTARENARIRALAATAAAIGPGGSARPPSRPGR